MILLKYITKQIIKRGYESNCITLNQLLNAKGKGRMKMDGTKERPPTDGVKNCMVWDFSIFMMDLEKR